MNTIELLIVGGRVLAVFAIVMTLVPLLTWVERKGAAYIQDRRGPNRASILGIRLGGLVHVVADAIKLFTKEGVVAATQQPALAWLAPLTAFVVAVAAAAVVPFTPTIAWAGHDLTLQVADLRSGLVFAIALNSLGAYALMMAGWGGGSGYAMLGALRAVAQFISASLAIGLAAVAIFLVAGTLSLSGIAAEQGAEPWRWNLIRQPLAFAIYMTALFAEANRLPFDLPEGESEIVAGYHTEYSGMRFALFYMAEYAHIAVGSAIAACLFLGGWNVPMVSTAAIARNAIPILAVAWPLLGVALAWGGGALMMRRRRRFRDLRDAEPLILGIPLAVAGILLLAAYPALGRTLLTQPWLPQAVVAATGLAMMLIKTMAIAALFIWVRWTLPRFRYDQLMRLGWKVLVPLGVANIVVTAAVLVYLAP